MSIRNRRIALDTNVWMYGLRQDPEYPACMQLLESLSSLRIVIPRQVLLELQVDLSPQESERFWRLVTEYSTRTEVSWDPSPPERLKRYHDLGCRRGDAAVGALAEHLRVEVLVTENRDFLRGALNLPFRVLSAADLLAELKAC